MRYIFVGIEYLSVKNYDRIYLDILFILNKDSGDSKITVYSITGQKVLEVNPENNRNATLDLSNIQKGVYVLRIGDKSKTITKKIVKI